MCRLPKARAVVDLRDVVEVLYKFSFKIKGRKLIDLFSLFVSTELAARTFDTEVAGPVVAPEVVVPPILGGATVADSCRWIVSAVVGKREELVIGNDNFEALVVDQRPESFISVFVHGHVGVAEVHGELSLHLELVEAVHRVVEPFLTDVEQPRPADVLVAAVGRRVSQSSGQKDGEEGAQW